MPISATSELNISNVTGDQTGSAVYTFENGLYMVAWIDGADVVYQLYNADGSAAGSTTIITSFDAPSNLAFTKLADGGVLLGVTNDTGGANGTDVAIVKFNSAGGVGLGYDVAPTALADNLTAASLTTLADGTVVSVWANATDSDRIDLRLFAPDIAGGASAIVNVVTGANSTSAQTAVAALENGSFVVLYTKEDIAATSSGIFAKIYSAVGGLEVAEFAINADTAGNAGFPDVKALAGGGFVATWSINQGANVMARFFSDAGVPASATDVVINSTAMATDLSADSHPQVTQLADGSVLVVWQSREGTTGLESNEIRARLFDANGTAINNDFLVNTTKTGSQEQPSVTAHADGTFTISWNGYNGANQDVYSRTFTPSKFYGTSGADTHIGLQVADTIYGYDGIDTITSRGGNDSVYGGTGNDVIDGGDGNDVLYGDDGADKLTGGLGNDKLFAGAAATGTNELDGGDGDDILYAGSGADKFIGGVGNDTLSYYYQGAVSIDLSATTTALIFNGGAVTGDSFAAGTTAKVENLDGSGVGSDILVGTSGANTLRGFGGNDSLTGGVGADRLFGGSGNDTINGGNDGDQIFGESGADSIDAGAGNDTVSSGAGADTGMNGGIGIDTLTYFSEATGAVMSLAGGTGSGSAAGDTTVANSFENLFGSNNATSGDTLTGTAVANIIRGYAGNDTLNGGAGADTLDGGLGNDTLNGGTDADLLSGGGGNDRYYGGAGLDKYTANATGADTYFFNAESDVAGGVETINTFNGNEDAFEFNDAGFTGLTVGALTSAMWQARLDNVAQRASDRFIYETDTRTLWFDSDGTGADAAVAIVKFGLKVGTFDYNDISIV